MNQCVEIRSAKIFMNWKWIRRYLESWVTHNGNSVNTKKSNQNSCWWKNAAKNNSSSIKSQSKFAGKTSKWQWQREVLVYTSQYYGFARYRVLAQLKVISFFLLSTKNKNSGLSSDLFYRMQFYFWISLSSEYKLCSLNFTLNCVHRNRSSYFNWFS